MENLPEGEACAHRWLDQEMPMPGRRGGDDAVQQMCRLCDDADQWRSLFNRFSGISSLMQARVIYCSWTDCPPWTRQECGCVVPAKGGRGLVDRVA